jgi:hypothetical protein
MGDVIPLRPFDSPENEPDPYEIESILAIVSELAPILGRVSPKDLPEGCHRLIEHDRSWFMSAYESLTEVEEAVVTARDHCDEDQAAVLVAEAQRSQPANTIRRAAALAAILYEQVDKGISEGNSSERAMEIARSALERSIEIDPGEAWLRIDAMADALYPIRPTSPESGPPSS